MDAKPHRPRVALPAIGNENMPLSKKEALHQRHKSTGNLQNAAKRTAFGDVSFKKNIDVGQAAAAFAAAGKGKNDVKAKGNSVQQTQGFAKPAQRASIAPAVKHDQRAAEWLNTNKMMIHQDSKALMPAQEAVIHPEPVHEASVPSQKEPLDVAFHGDVNVDQAALAALSVQDQAVVDPSSVNLETSDAPSSLRQPRHTKSQPALRKKASTLQAAPTQEHQENLDPNDIIDFDIQSQLDDLAESAYEDALEQLDEHNQEAVHAQLEEEHELAIAETGGSIDPKLIADVPADIPEECWNELDEEDLYDDQGYTTAHSYGSRGDLTTGGLTTLVAPKVTDNIERELYDARIYVENNYSVAEMEDDAWDVCMVAEYSEEIFSYFRELEVKMLPDPHYMDHQMEIQWSMRSVLMDWLVQVHSRFNLLPETLFLTVNYIDRFLSLKAVSINKLQLVGATALLVASKYEEINCPSLEEVVYMVDGGYAVDEILKAEKFMLSMLGFELGFPGPMSFLRRISKADDYDLETRTLAKYFLEVTIMDERFVASPPSFLAAGAHCLSRMILNKGDWSLAHVHFSGYTWSQLKPLVSMIMDCCYAPNRHHQAVYEKYADKRFKRASEFVQEEIEKGFVLPIRTPTTRHSIFNFTAGGNIDEELNLMQPTNSMVPVELRG